MAINDFEFPGVELHQEFVEAPVTGVSQLGVAVVGYQYKLSPYTAKYNGTALSISLFNLPGYTENETIDTSANAPKGVIVQDGLFNIFVTGTTSAIKTVPADSPIAQDKSYATIKFDAPLLSGTASTTAFGTLPPQVDDPVDVYIGDSAASTAALITAVSGAEMRVEPVSGVFASGGTVTNVSFWKQAEAQLLDSDVTFTDDTTITIGANASAKIGGKTDASPLATNLDEYNFLLKYRDGENTYVHQLGAVGSMTEIKDIFGAITPDNPMALALSFALQAANGNIVYFTSTAGHDSKDNFDDVMDFLDKYDVVYSVVPVFEAATTIADKQAILKSMVAYAESGEADPESKNRRSIWYGLFEDTTDVTVTNSLDQLIKTKTAVGSSYRAQAVWAKAPVYAGYEIDSTALAAAAAGMRCYEPAYRPISNLTYNFFSLKPGEELTKTEMKKLGRNGIWLIDNNYDGTPINMRQLTTAASNNLNKDEESIVANADSIALTLCHVGENLVGCSNINPDLLVALHDTITGIMDNYTVNRTGNVYIGPQLISWTLDALYQDPVQRDHIYATITCEPPRPFNRFVLTLRVV